MNQNGKTTLYENLFLDSNEVRKIEFSNQHNYYNKPIISRHDVSNSNIEQTDGLLLFGSQWKNQNEQHRLEILKKFIIDDLMPIGHLNNPNIAEPNSSNLKKVFRTLNRIDKLLCAKDPTYKNRFENVRYFNIIF